MSDTITDSIFGANGGEVISDVFETDEPTPTSPYKEDQKPPPDKHAGPRASGEDIIGAGVAFAGTLLVSKQVDVPVGRCIQFQAAITGKKLDDLIANTWIDKMLQPLFKKGDQFNELGAVLGLPVLIGICERKPAMAPMLMGAMEEFVLTTLNEMALMRKRDKAKTRRVVRSSEIREMLDMPDDIKDEQIPTFVVHSFFAMEEMHDAGTMPE